MAAPDDVLAAALQTAAAALGDYLAQKFTAQDQKISELEKKLSSRPPDAQLHGNGEGGTYHEVRESIDGLQGQIDQLDGVLNGLSNDSAQFTADILALQADAQAQAARIGRRASRRDLDTVSAALDELRTKVIGIPDQITEISRVLHNVQGQVSNLRESGDFQDPASELVITDVPMSDKLELFEDASRSASGELVSSADTNPIFTDTSFTKATGQKTARPSQRMDDVGDEVTPATQKQSKGPIVQITPQSFKPVNNKAIMKSMTGKQTARNRRPSSAFPSPSQVSRWVTTGSESTVKANTPKQQRGSNARRAAPSQSGSLSSGLSARTMERVPISVADSDEDTEEEHLVDNAENEAELVRSSVETNEEMDSHPIAPDTQPVTRMHRDLYRNAWHAGGRVGTLDEYVRQQRATVNIDDDDAPRTRVKTLIDYEQTLLPKARTTRAPRANRPTDVNDEMATIEAALEGRSQKKQKRASFDNLLKTFQSPTKKASQLSGKAAKRARLASASFTSGGRGRSI